MNKILTSFIFIALFVGTASATSNDFFQILGKTQTCVILNVTGTACDAQWCDIISSDELPCSYNATLSSCFCILTIQNETNSSSLLAIIESLNATIQNQTDVSQSDFIAESKNYTDSSIVALRDSLTNRIENESTIYLSRQADIVQVQPSKDYTFLFVILVIGVLVGVYFVVTKTRANKIDARPVPTTLRKIKKIVTTTPVPLGQDNPKLEEQTEEATEEERNEN